MHQKADHEGQGHAISKSHNTRQPHRPRPISLGLWLTSVHTARICYLQRFLSSHMHRHFYYLKDVFQMKQKIRAIRSEAAMSLWISTEEGISKHSRTERSNKKGFCTSNEKPVNGRVPME